MKGIILAGGTGSRLYPITKSVCKQLLPIYDKPMIYYPLSVLMLAGIKDIMVITTPNDHDSFCRLLGDGSQFGINIHTMIQDSPGGIAQAFLLGNDFIGNDTCSLILGDNIFFGQGLRYQLSLSINIKFGANIFGYHTLNPEKYGVVNFDENSNIISLEEKPKNPKSNYAITGLYFYDNRVIDFVKELKPSLRGELEITDLNNIYLKDGSLSCCILGRGIAWLDTGSAESILQASQFVQTVQERQGLFISCPEEIAFNQGWIDENILIKNANNLGDTSYSNYLRKLIK